MNYNEEYNYYYLHEVLETQIIKYTADAKYEYLIALGFILSSDSMSLEYPGASYYFKYNAQYQVYLLNGETFEGDFTISSSNFSDIEKQLVILEIL